MKRQQSLYETLRIDFIFIIPGGIRSVHGTNQEAVQLHERQLLSAAAACWPSTTGCLQNRGLCKMLRFGCRVQTLQNRRHLSSCQVLLSTDHEGVISDCPSWSRCDSFLPGVTGCSGRLCLPFCEKAVCPRCWHITLKWENFGGPAERISVLNITSSSSIQRIAVQQGQGKEL